MSVIRVSITKTFRAKDGPREHEVCCSCGTRIWDGDRMIEGFAHGNRYVFCCEECLDEQEADWWAAEPEEATS